MISFVTGLMMYRMATMEEWQETTLTIIPWIQPLLWIISVNTGFPTNPITIYRYTGERDLGEKKKDTTKFQKVFINGYSDLGSTNDGNAAKEAIYEALSLRGPLLGTIDLSLSFSEYRGDHVLRPENIESGSEFNPGSDDPSNDDSLDKNNSSSSNNKSGSQDSGFQDSGSKDSRSQDSGSHDSGSHDSGSHDSGTHYSGSHDSGSHDSSSHASDDAGNICHAIVIVGMDYDENYFLVLNSQGLDWGVDGVGKVDCSLIFDILEPHVNDDRNRGMKGPALSALAYSPKQQRELKHLGKGMPEKCLASGPDIPALLGTVDAEDEKNPFEHVTQSPKSLRVPGSVREPINPAWRCFHNVIGDLRCPISDTRCQTETGGFMMEHLQLLTRSTGHLDFPRLEVERSLKYALQDYF